jgi:hypothetical protein
LNYYDVLICWYIPQVNDAEMERLESEKVHLKTTQKFKEAEEQVLKLQKDLKRSINKSK